MNLVDFFLGYSLIQIKSEDCRRFFNICGYHGLLLRDIQGCSERDDLEKYQLYIRNRELDQVKAICKKTNTTVECIQKRGISVWIDYIKKHIWFMAGAVMALFLLFIYSRRIWDIQIDGNRYYDNWTIIRQLKEINIRSGMPYAQIDCSELSSYIRNLNNKITWASAELDGSKLIIHIKENLLLKEEDDSYKSGDAWDLVADKDGIINNILVRQGISEIDTGQQVKKGDILISGWIPIYNDSGEVVGNEVVCADGDVTIMSTYAYYHEINRKWCEYTITDSYFEPLIQIGNYRWECDVVTALYNKNNEYSTLTTHEKPIQITTTLSLPIKVGYQRRVFYEKNDKKYSDSQLKDISEREFYLFCSNLEKKGVQIYENDVKMYMSDASCVMAGNISIIEQTGILKQSDFLQNDRNQMEE